MLCSLCEIMKNSGYIKDYKIHSVGNKNFLIVYPKFLGNKKVLNQFKIVSKPSSRRYINNDQIKMLHNRNKFMLNIVSTSHGLMSFKDAVNKGIGGEFVCCVF